MVFHCNSLEELWQEVYRSHQSNFPNHELMPILGNGKTDKPKVMFVFINPTKRNASSHKDWPGPRFPFIGTKQIWRIFQRAGLFDENLMTEIDENSVWSLELTERVLQFLKTNDFYLTNIVKWTGHDATLPNAEKIDLFLPILKREIELVQPEYIVTFGLIPFESLLKQKIKLKDYYEQALRQKSLRSYDLRINSLSVKVIPCYFPVGRGDPKKAVELLKLVKDL